MLEDLKKEVWENYSRMEGKGFFSLKRGSLSAIDRVSGKVVINSRGDNSKIEDMCVLSENGDCLEGDKPALDYETHLELYKIYPDIESIMFTQSGYTMVWAEMCERIRPFSTYHAEYFRGEVLCTTMLGENVMSNFNVGVANAIKDVMKARSTDDMPGVLVAQHGAYVWGKSAKHAGNIAIALEEIAKSAWHMVSVAGLNVKQIPFWVQEAKFAESNQK